MDRNTVKIAICAAAVAAVAACATAQNARRGNNRAAAAEQPEAAAEQVKVTVDQFPRIGRPATFKAPEISGGTNIGKCWPKPRSWIVLEAKYSTYAKWTDRLVFTWHVLLDTKTATEKSRGDREKLAPYSYLSQSVTYVNIPKGTHAASVCLPPSYLERFGEARAVGLVIANSDGETLYFDAVSEIRGIVSHPKGIEQAFWQDNSIMEAKTKDGEAMIERRQGLVDRSKTIWAIVNPNDYETVAE